MGSAGMEEWLPEKGGCREKHYFIEAILRDRRHRGVHELSTLKFSHNYADFARSSSSSSTNLIIVDLSNRFVTWPLQTSVVSTIIPSR